MKFTKFIPLALALTLFCPAFAGTSDTSTMNITVNDYINITASNATQTVAANPTADYANLELADSLGVTFHVVTNHPGDHVYLTATTLAAGSAVNALCAGSASGKYYLVFGKNSTDSSSYATLYNTTLAAVQNITNGESVSPESNANAIAFEITPDLSVFSGAATAAPDPDTITAGGVVAYDLNNGIYDMTYTLANSPVASTFSTHDTNGTYQAILKLSHTNP